MDLFNPVCVNLVAGHILLSCCLFTALAAQPAISSPVCVCLCVRREQREVQGSVCLY